MFWHHEGMTGPGYLWMLWHMLVWWALLVAAALVIWAAIRPAHVGRAGRSTERLLAERLARGEIDEDEYRRRLDALRHA